MACQVEIMNGSDLNEKDSVEDNDSENEILALKQSLKEKLRGETVNGTVNGNINGASSSSSSSVINNEGSYENGLEEEKQNSDLNQDTASDSKRQTPKKSSKGKMPKGKKGTPSKSKKQLPIKKVDVILGEESTRSAQPWNGAEPSNKDTEDDSIIIDVVDDSDEHAIADDIELSTADDIHTERTDETSEEVKEENTMLARLRNTMRFSISPRKQAVVSSSSSEGSSSFHSSFDGKEPSRYSLRGISGRRPLHHCSFPFESREAEPSFSKNLKRKAVSESPEAPQRKYFITSLSERSPGWKFFSSPFSRFWSPKKKLPDTTVTSSTPLRKLHEDVNVEDSMAVNIDESVDISIDEDLEIEKQDLGKEKKYSKEEVPVFEDDNNPAPSWRCIIM